MIDANEYMDAKDKFLVEYKGDIYAVDSVFFKTASDDFVEYKYTDICPYHFMYSIIHGHNDEDETIYCCDGAYYFIDKSCTPIEYICIDGKYYISEDTKPIKILEYNGNVYPKDSLQAVDVIEDNITENYYIKDDSALVDFEIIYGNDTYYKLPDKLIPCKNADFQFIEDDGEVYRLEDVTLIDVIKNCTYRNAINFQLHCRWGYNL
jgi:hypothetical protein